MSAPVLGVIGATSAVGECVLARLWNKGQATHALTRQDLASPTVGRLTASFPSRDIVWHRLSGEPRPNRFPIGQEIDHWLWLAPIWTLPNYFRALEASGARHIVALSSTSRMTKVASPDAGERRVARRLEQAEEELCTWADDRSITWTILRPTLIYGLGRDQNICRIAAFVRRFGFFPIMGEACGLRQPVHAEDVAEACLAALETLGAVNRTYTIAGGETLAYREMVERIFLALGRRPRLVPIPYQAFRLSVSLIKMMRPSAQWSPEMARRMNQDLAFDTADAEADLSLTPRKFHPSAADLGIKVGHS